MSQLCLRLSFESGLPCHWCRGRERSIGSLPVPDYQGWLLEEALSRLYTWKVGLSLGRGLNL